MWNCRNKKDNNGDEKPYEKKKTSSNLIGLFIFLNIFFVVILVGGFIWNHYLLADNQERIITKYDSCVAAINKDTIRQQTKNEHVILKLQDNEEAIKNILEQEYNKIQSEYESVEIWVGVITVVFLIFSFYSLFKTEQFEKLSREASHRILGKAEDWERKEKDYDKQVGDLKRDMKAALDDTQQKKDELEKKYKSLFRSA